MSFIVSIYLHTSIHHLYIYRWHILNYNPHINCTSYRCFFLRKAKTLSKPEPVQSGIKLCPQGIPVWTGFTVFRLCPNIFSFAGSLNLLYCVLSNQNIIWTPYSKRSQVLCYDFSKSSSMFFRICPGFSGSLCCSLNANGSIRLLVKWADTTYWLARQ